MEICKSVAPRNIEVEPEHFVRCHLYDSEGMLLEEAKRQSKKGSGSL
jgi:hypothetical protein